MTSSEIYIVQHNMGMDGSYVVCVFSKKEDAEKLCEMYNNSSEADDYDWYSFSTLIVDNKKIENYKFKSVYECSEEDPEDYVCPCTTAACLGVSGGCATCNVCKKCEYSALSDKKTLVYIEEG